MGNNKSKAKKANPPPQQNNFDALFEQIFEMKQRAKEFKRCAEKSQKEEEVAKAKVKDAIQKNLPEIARIFASDAIRYKNEYINYLTLSSKIESICGKLKGAEKKEQLAQSINKVATGMAIAMKQTNLVALVDSMQNFEKQFEKLDIMTSVIDNSLESVQGGSVQDQADVDKLIANVALVHNLEIQDNFDLKVGNISSGGVQIKNQQQQQKVEEQKMREVI